MVIHKHSENIQQISVLIYSHLRFIKETTDILLSSEDIKTLPWVQEYKKKSEKISRQDLKIKFNLNA